MNRPWLLPVIVVLALALAAASSMLNDSEEKAPPVSSESVAVGTETPSDSTLSLPANYGNVCGNGGTIQRDGLCSNSCDLSLDSGVTFVASEMLPSGSVTRGEQSALLGSFQLLAVGEVVEVRELTFAVDSSDDSFESLSNVSVFNGEEQIGLVSELQEMDGAVGSTTYGFYPPLTLEDGIPAVISLRADIVERKGDITPESTIQAKLMFGQDNAVGLTSCATYSLFAANFNISDVLLVK